MTKPAAFQKQAQKLLRILETNHPSLFPTDGTPPKPWKINIQEDIRIRYAVTKRVTKIALSLWQRHNHESYVATLIKNNLRYNLDGEWDGFVRESWEDTWKRKQREREAKRQEQQC